MNINTRAGTLVRFRRLPYLLIKISANDFVIIIFFTFQFANPSYKRISCV